MNHQGIYSDPKTGVTSNVTKSGFDAVSKPKMSRLGSQNRLNSAKQSEPKSRSKR